MTPQTKLNWENFELLKKVLTPDKLLDELMQAMSAKECKENLEFIARMHDIEIKED